MSRYSYAGEFRNPADSYFVKPVDEHFEVWVRSERAKDGSAEADRPHNRAPKFDGAEDAEEYIDHIRETFEEDYSDYLEENHAELARMDAWEAFKREY